MPRRVSLDLPPDPRAARQAREFVRSLMSQWRLDAAVDTVQLLTSELVTNGVLHARTPLGVVIEEAGGEITVEVHDHDPRPPTPRGHRLDLLGDIDRALAQAREVETHVDERHAVMHVGPAGAIGAGRGLLLVEALADEWGVEEKRDGKSVWFRIAA